MVLINLAQMELLPLVAMGEMEAFQQFLEHQLLMLEAVAAELTKVEHREAVEQAAVETLEIHLLLEPQTQAVVGVAVYKAHKQMVQQAALVLSLSNGHNLYQPQQHLLQQANGKPLRA